MIPIPALTGIRGLAAVMVFIGHAALLYFSAFPSSSFVVPLAHIRMTTFFTLSGFVIHWNYEWLFRTGSYPTALREFFIARFARLWPLHSAIVVLALFTAPYDPARSLLHVFMVQSWPYPPSGVNQAYYNTWSISTEWFCYLVYAAVVVPLMRRIAQRPVILFAAMIVGALALHWIAGPPQDQSGMWLRYHSPYLRLLEFLTGVTAANFVMKGGPRLPPSILLLVAISTVGPLYFSTFAGAILINYLFAPLTAFTMIAVTQNEGKPLAKTLSAKWLLWLGDRSYSIYLLQAVVIVHLGRFLHPPFGLLEASAITFLFALAIAVGSNLSWRFFEEPTRRFFKRLRGPRSSRDAV